MKYIKTRNKRGDILYWKVDARGKKRRVKKSSVPSGARTPKTTKTHGKIPMPKFAPSLEYWGGWHSGGRFGDGDYSYTIEWTPEGNLKWKASKVGSAETHRWVRKTHSSVFAKFAGGCT